MPGYGNSPIIEPCTFDGLADALAALMDAQGLQQAVLVGHSLGGMVALQMWARHPERVAGLVLATSSPGFGQGSGDFQKAFIAQRLAPLEAGQSMADVAQTLVPTMVAPGFDGPGLAQAKACMGSISPAAYKAALSALVQEEGSVTSLGIEGSSLGSSTGGMVHGSIGRSAGRRSATPHRMAALHRAGSGVGGGSPRADAAHESLSEAPADAAQDGDTTCACVGCRNRYDVVAIFRGGCVAVFSARSDGF
jgi:pimeloyl-ACP methyl ester carboxylesterase